MDAEPKMLTDVDLISAEQKLKLTMFPDEARKVFGHIATQQAEIARIKQTAEKFALAESRGVEVEIELRNKLEAAEAEIERLKQHLATQPTTMDEITFREALRSEVITVTLQDNEKLQVEIARLRNALERAEIGLESAGLFAAAQAARTVRLGITPQPAAEEAK
jgi:hypothetical protein